MERLRSVDTASWCSFVHVGTTTKASRSNCMNVPDGIAPTGVDLESDIARTAQRYVELVPTVVLGSGASAELGLPLMKELGKRLVDSVRPTSKGDRTKWRGIAARLRGGQDLEAALSTSRPSKALLAQIVRATWQFVSRRDLRAYEKLVTNAAESSHARLFKYLLRSANKQIEVVTTNYDRLAEYGADLAFGTALTGFTSGWIQRWESQAHERGERHRVRVVKVHGSLDWFRSASGEIVGMPLQSRIPRTLSPCVVTPGLDKYREAYEEPFRSAIANADQALVQARSFFCAGYGFNDEHIQPKLIARMRQDAVPIVVIARSLTPRTRQLLLEPAPPPEYMLVEKHAKGSIAYCKLTPEGYVFHKKNYWTLDGFISGFLQ